jgi:hypothetical protein
MEDKKLGELPFLSVGYHRNYFLKKKEKKKKTTFANFLENLCLKFTICENITNV